MSEAIVVTAEFRLKPGTADEWLQLMLDHYGPACVQEHGMSPCPSGGRYPQRYWLHHNDQDRDHILLYEQWADRSDFDASMRADWRAAYHNDTERLWDKPRVVTIYRRIATPWEPLTDDGLPESLTRD